MDSENLQDQIQSLLGEPPWDENLLERLYLPHFTETQDFIKSHPGYNVYSEFESTRLSLDVFLSAVADLSASINRFKGESAKPNFWLRPQRQFVEELGIAIQRGVVSSATFAKALVDHSNRFSTNYPIPEYSDKVSEYFVSSQEHKFIQGLRNCIAHFKLPEANFRSTFSREGDRRVFFLISQGDLLKCDGWTSLAKKYIHEHPKGVDVEQLFKSYSAKVAEFHNWLHSAVLESYGESMSGYLYYQNLLDRFSVRCHWRAILTHVIQNGINPYVHLNSHLTKQELTEVLSFSYRSKAQVDRIIDLVDECSACTEELRGLAYQCFKVPEI